MQQVEQVVFAAKVMRKAGWRVAEVWVQQFIDEHVRKFGAREDMSNLDVSRFWIFVDPCVVERCGFAAIHPCCACHRTCHQPQKGKLGLDSFVCSKAEASRNCSMLCVSVVAS